MNKRQALFWSLQLWRIIQYTNFTNLSKTKAIYYLTEEIFSSVKIDWDFVFDTEEYDCPCCAYVKERMPDYNVLDENYIFPCSFCVDNCPGKPLWPSYAGCCGKTTLYTNWRSSIDTNLKREYAKAIADGFEKLYLEECQKGGKYHG